MTTLSLQSPLLANRSRWIIWCSLCFILLLAAFLRMGFSGIVEYKRDEANLSQLSLDMVQDGDIPLLGIGSSVGFPNAPVNVYVLAIPYAISSNPEFATQFIGFLNVLAVVGVYVLASRYTNPVIALLIALVYAVSPWSLIFSRKIWAQNMLPPFVVFTVYTGIAGFFEGRKWAQISHLPVLAVMGQIHYGAFVMIPVSLWMMFSGRKRITLHFGIGIVIAVLVCLPYVIGLAQADLLNPSTLMESVEASDTDDEPIGFTGSAIDGAWLLIAGTDIHSLAGPQEFMTYLDSVPFTYPLFDLLSVGVLVSALWLVWRSVRYRDERTPVDIALVIWLWFPVFAYSVTWTPFFVHYLIPILPAAFLILGFGLSDLWQALASRRSLRAVVLALISSVWWFIFAMQLGYWIILLFFVDTTHTPDGFGTPLHYLNAVVDEIQAYDVDQVIGAFDGQAIGFDGEPTVWNTLLTDIPAVRFEDRQTRVYPVEDAVWLTDDCDDDRVLIRFPLRPDEGCYGLSIRSAEDLSVRDYTAIDEADSRFANGVGLQHYRWLPDEACLELVWRITQTTTDDFMFAVHFFDVDGERVATADALSWFGRYWQPDDVVWRRFCVGADTSAFVEVRIGMYTYDGVNFFNVPLVNRDEFVVPLTLSD